MDIDHRRLPTHVGLIMDGNGRWAERRGQPRTKGHEAGEAALVDVVDGALELGLRYLTVYAFSTENWSRPGAEVRFLMNFNRQLLLRRRDEFDEKGVRLRFIGRRRDRRVPRRLIKVAEEAEALTADNDRLHLTIALNYGGWAELVDAFQTVMADVVEGRRSAADVDEDVIRRALYAPEVPDADVIIRTSGEQRVSNFLLWQGAYAELVFTDTLWPDFRRQDLFDGIAAYQQRVRRFGAVS